MFKKACFEKTADKVLETSNKKIGAELDCHGGFIFIAHHIEKVMKK